MAGEIVSDEALKAKFLKAKDYADRLALENGRIYSVRRKGVGYVVVLEVKGGDTTGNHYTARPEGPI